MPKKPPNRGENAPPRNDEGARTVAWLTLRRAEEPGARGGQEILAELAEQARLDPRDRALAFQMVQGVWRRRRLLDAAISALEGFEKAEIAPGPRDILRLGAYQHFYLDRVPTRALVHATVEMARRRLGERQAGFTNAVLRRLTTQFAGGRADLEKFATGLPRQKRLSFSGLTVRITRRTVGAEALDEALEAMNRPAPLHARANLAAASAETIALELSESGVATRHRPDLAPSCLDVEDTATRLTQTDAFRRGALIIQDASAQLVSAFVGARPGMTVVDWCAAPGGKTTALAEAMRNKGHLVACEVSVDRRKRLKENLLRMGVDGFVGVRATDGSQKAAEALRATLPEGGANRVLVDAPCSGLGTLRRHPEIRWRLRKTDIERLARLQGEILDQTACLVKRSGWLVYATCSLAPRENERVVEAFLERHAGQFEPVAANDKEAGALSESLSPRVRPDGWLRLLPHRDDMDSAAAIRLRRIA